MTLVHRLGGGALRRSTLIIGVGVSFALVGYYFIKRYWKWKLSETNEHGDETGGQPLDIFPRTAEMAARSGNLRRTPSVGSSQRVVLRGSSNIPPCEQDLISCSQRVQDLMGRLERVLSSLDLVRNRSEKDLRRAELLSSIVDRLRILETDVSRIIQDGGYERDMLPSEEVFWSSGGNHRSGSLSVLSDDSFVSAFEEFPVTIGDADLIREPLNLDKELLCSYHDGLNAGEVAYRKNRTEFCGCTDELDFQAKLWCVRQAFEVIFAKERNRVWLSQAGRQLIADLLRHSGQDPCKFYTAYDAMMEYLQDCVPADVLENELRQRGVAQFGFWDVVLDYVLIDAFEDLAKPPSAVLAVTKNMYLSHALKHSTLSTVIWSMLRAKRSRLTVRDGFIAHFYDISEAASPTLTLGFLGTDEHLRDLCYYFKEQICSFISDIFNFKKVRYTSIEDLAEDVQLIMEARLEMVQTRLSTELLPPF